MKETAKDKEKIHFETETDAERDIGRRIVRWRQREIVSEIEVGTNKLGDIDRDGDTEKRMHIEADR